MMMIMIYVAHENEQTDCGIISNNCDLGADLIGCVAHMINLSVYDALNLPKVNEILQNVFII